MWLQPALELKTKGEQVMSKPSFWTVDEYLAKEGISEIELKRKIAHGLIVSGSWVSQLPVSIHRATCHIPLLDDSNNIFTIYSDSGFYSLYGLIQLNKTSWLKAWEQGSCELYANAQLSIYEISDLTDFSQSEVSPSPKYKSPFQDHEITKLMERCFGKFNLWDTETDESKEITKAIFEYCCVTYPDRKKPESDQTKEILTSLVQVLAEFEVDLEDMVGEGKTDLEKIIYVFKRLIGIFRRNDKDPTFVLETFVVPSVTLRGDILDMARMYFPQEVQDSIDYHWPKDRKLGLGDINLVKTLWGTAPDYKIAKSDLVILKPTKNGIATEKKLSDSLGSKDLFAPITHTEGEGYLIAALRDYVNNQATAPRSFSELFDYIWFRKKDEFDGKTLYQVCEKLNGTAERDYRSEVRRKIWQWKKTKSIFPKTDTYQIDGKSI